MKECLSSRIYELANEREGREGREGRERREGREGNLKLLSFMPLLKVVAQI